MTKEKNTPLKWKFETRELVVSSPAVSEGVVYFGSECREDFFAYLNTV